jgi:hypothetical protein
MVDIINGLVDERVPSLRQFADEWEGARESGSFFEEGFLL